MKKAYVIGKNASKSLSPTIFNYWFKKYMEEWQEGEIIENKKWTENLASLKIKANINLHKAGQFTRLGLKQGNDLVTRSYSYASAPQDDLLEIIYVNPHV